MTAPQTNTPIPETAHVCCHGDAPGQTGASTADAPALQHDATITCPACGAATTARMPTDACQFFWDCPACGVLLQPKPGDCCVFCSYGDAPCPPIQLAQTGSD